MIDIDCAFSHGYPVEKADKVLKRKADCLNKLQSPLKENTTNSKSNEERKSNTNETLKDNNNLPTCDVNFKPNYLSNAVEITQIKSKGGYGIRAIDSINCGSTILEERSAIGILSPEYYDKYCYHCFKLLNCQPFPCRNCNQVSFCSTNCSSISWNQYHSGECCYLDYFIFTKAFHYVPKIVLRVLLICGPIDCLKYHRDQQQQSKSDNIETEKSTITPTITSLEENESSEFDKSKKKKKKKKKQSTTITNETSSSSSTQLASNSINQLYQSIYSLVEHPEDSNDYKYFTMKIIIYLKDIVKKEIPDDSISLLSELIVKHFRSTIVNAIAIQDRLIDHSKDWTINLADKIGIPQINEIEIGCGLYLTFRYLNHSCIPNIHLAWFHDNSLKMIAIRDIKSGEEILNSYGVHYKYQLASRRKQLLKSSYYFDCACEACVTGLQPLSKAFNCPTCSGPVICDGSIVCLDCGAKDHLDVQSIMSQTEAFFGLINYDSENRSPDCDEIPRLKVTEKLLIEVYTGLSVFLYKTHTEMGKLYHKLINCYLKLGKFRKSYEFSKKYLEVVKASSSGSFDINVLNGLLIVLVCCHQYHSNIQKSPPQSSSSSSTISLDLEKISNQVNKLVNHLIPSSLPLHKEILDFVASQTDCLSITKSK